MAVKARPKKETTKKEFKAKKFKPQYQKDIMLKVGRKSYAVRLLAHPKAGFTVAALETMKPAGYMPTAVGEPFECLIAMDTRRDKTNYKVFMDYFFKTKRKVYSYSEYLDEQMKIGAGFGWGGMPTSDICRFS